ncbi:MAG: PAS domain S-box protein, partial [Dehalococcoidia bacterium]
MAVDAPSGLLDDTNTGAGLIDAVGCGIWLYDGDDILFVNEALARITGFTRDELLAHQFFQDLMHPDDREMIVARGRARVRGEPVPPDYDVSVIARDGRRVWLHIHASMVEYQGRSCSLVSALDISERKEAEAAVQFLADVSAELGASLDYNETLKRITGLAVPYLGDYAVTDILNEAGRLERIAGAHRDPYLQERMEHNMPDSGRFGPGHPIHDAVATGRSVVTEGDVPARVALDADHLAILQELKPATYIVVPLLGSRGAILGSMAFGLERRLPQWQLSLILTTAEEVGRRAAHAIEQARLYERANRAAQDAAYNWRVLDAMFAAAPIAMVFLDRDLRIVDINHVAARKSISIADHIGKHPREVMPAHWEVVGPLYEGVLASREPVLEVEHSQTHPKSGRTTTWASSYYPVFGDHDELLGVAGVGVDITARKATAEETRRSEERLRLAQSAARMGTWEWDVASGEVTWSEAMEAVYGIEPGSFPGTFEAFLHSVHPDDRGTVMASVQQLEADGHSDMEHRIIRPDGEVRWLAGRGQMFRGLDGRPLKAIGVGIDITERKEVEAELRRANAAKDELLGLVSHELRTPLTNVLGNALALRRHDAHISTADRAAALDDIAASGERLQRLIENMLVLSHVEARTDVQTEPVLLQRVLVTLLAEHRARLPRTLVELQVVADLPPVLAQPTYLEQIVQNLLSNAEKYAPPGRPVEVVATCDADVV